MDDIPARTVLTGCGRRLVTGQLVVPAPLSGRVTLRIEPGTDERTTWVTLTSAEAIRLAALLVTSAREIGGVMADDTTVEDAVMGRAVVDGRRKRPVLDPARADRLDRNVPPGTLGGIRRRLWWS